MVVRNEEWYGEVGVLVKEELFEKVIEVRRVNDRVMSLDFFIFFL